MIMPDLFLKSGRKILNTVWLAKINVVTLFQIPVPIARIVEQNTVVLFRLLTFHVSHRYSSKIVVILPCEGNFWVILIP